MIYMARQFVAAATLIAVPAQAREMPPTIPEIRPFAQTQSGYEMSGNPSGLPSYEITPPDAPNMRCIVATQRTGSENPTMRCFALPDGPK